MSDIKLEWPDGEPVTELGSSEGRVATAEEIRRNSRDAQRPLRPAAIENIQIVAEPMAAESLGHNARRTGVIRGSVPIELISGPEQEMVKDLLRKGYSVGIYLRHENDAPDEEVLDSGCCRYPKRCICAAEVDTG